MLRDTFELYIFAKVDRGDLDSILNRDRNMPFEKKFCPINLVLGQLIAQRI